MSVEESIQQIETLIEAWQLDEADLNQTDINAMQVLLKENQKLKQKLNWIAFGDDAELALRYLRKIGYVDFDEERKVYINKHNNEPFLLDDEEEKAYYIKDEELNEYTEQLEYQNKELKKQVEVGEEQYNDLVEEKEELQEQLSSNTLQLTELKKQLEDKILLEMKLENELFNKRKEYQDTYKDVRIEIKEYKTQQKEFIEYMNKTIEELQCDDVDDEEMKGYLIQRIYTFKEILQKYKSIIGGNKDEK